MRENNTTREEIRRVSTTQNQRENVELRIFQIFQISVTVNMASRFHTCYSWHDGVVALQLQKYVVFVQTLLYILFNLENDLFIKLKKNHKVLLSL